jgi:hypothetical protein
MVCVMQPAGRQTQKVISERQRSASARRPTSSAQSCVSQTLRAEVLLRRASPSELLVRNQIRLQFLYSVATGDACIGAPTVRTGRRGGMSSRFRQYRPAPCR